MQITLNLYETLINEALQLTNLETQEEMMSLALQNLCVHVVAPLEHRAARRTCLTLQVKSSLPPTLIIRRSAKPIMLLIDTFVWCKQSKNQNLRIHLNSQ
jgi:hypothetical protein